MFFLLLIFGMWWLCSAPPMALPVLVNEEVFLERDDRASRRPRGAYGDASCSDPVVAAATAPAGVFRTSAMAAVPLEVGPVQVASIGGLNMPGMAAAGTALAGAFDLSDPGKEYMAAYNPTGLASVMPAGWRTDGANAAKCASIGDGNYAEFSRYSISPEAVARSENMRGVMRLSENTRQGLGRTLGYQSLLRNYVTPVGPQPIGDKAMLWNDSSVRQSYIAAVQGSFPDLGLC